MRVWSLVPSSPIEPENAEVPRKDICEPAFVAAEMGAPGYIERPSQL
jgi:hypothetical protein